MSSFLIHPAIRNTTPFFEQLRKTKAQLWLFDTFSTQKICSPVDWFHSTIIFQRLYFCFLLDWPFVFNVLYFSWNVNITYFMEGQTDDQKRTPWNSLGPCFHSEIDAVFYSCIGHDVRSNSLLENAWLSEDYFAEFENVFIGLITSFSLSQKTVLFKIYFKSVVFQIRMQ